MTWPLVYVVVLNYNGRQWVSRCLETLLSTRYDNFKVIFVDNASTDDSLQVANQYSARVQVIPSASNEGFPNGNNIGIRKALAAGASYVVLLNPDTAVEPDWLKELIHVGEMNPDVGILGSVQLSYEGSGFNSWTEKRLADYLNYLSGPSIKRQWISTDWVEGSCMAIKKSTLEATGLLDPIYFAFYEEIDLCRRALFRGRRIAVVPNSRIHHYRGGIWRSDAGKERRRNYLINRSQFIYNLTAPEKPFLKNVASYLVTLGTKAKEAVRDNQASQWWDLSRIQLDIFRNLTRIFAKGRRDRRAYK